MEHFVWDMSPVMFEFGLLRVHWYGFLFAFGFFLGHLLMIYFYHRECRSTENQATLLLYLLVGALIGARLGHVLFYDLDYFLAHPWQVLMFWRGGLASHGGFIAVLIAIYLYVRRYREMSFLELADRLAIPMLLVATMIRVGNLFNSEILGKPTDVPWAIVFRRVDDLPRHPVMLYEAAAYFIAFCALYLAYLKTNIARYPGRLIGAGFAVSFSARFAIEFFKENQTPIEESLPINMGQLLSIPFIVLGLYLIRRSSKTPPAQTTRP